MYCAFNVLYIIWRVDCMPIVAQTLHNTYCLITFLKLLFSFVNHFLGSDLMANIVRKQLNKQMFTICIEGNIGSGKSSSLKHLSDKYHNVITHCEPMDRWVNLRGHNMIEMLYKDLNRNAFSFEHFSQLTRLEMFANSYETTDHDKHIRLMERSIYSARHCFTQNLFNSGNLSKPEFIIIDEWFKRLSAKPCLKADLIIYLRTSPQTVLQRIQNRSRNEEMQIPIEYLKELHELHDNWLLDENRSIDCPDVLTFDADLPQKQLFASLDTQLDHVLKHIL